MPPKVPRNNPPIAKLSLTGQVGRTVTISTLGTTAGSTGQGRFKTPSQLASWKIYWGDQQQEAGVGIPPTSFTHTYETSVGATAYILFIVVDVNTLTAQATLTIEGMGQVPNAPTNLTASPLGPTSILLGWTDTVANAQTYTVEMSPHGANTFVVIGTVSAPTTTFTATGLSANTAYDFRVLGTNTLGSSGYSNIASATTDPAFPLPAAPSALMATTISTTRIDLAWTDNSGGTASFEIQRRSATGPYEFAATTAVGVVTYSDTGLTPATQYFYRVRAVSLGGASAFSNEANATTNTAPPAAPTGLTATPLSSSSIAVNWTASAGATGYTVERSLHGAGVWTTVATPSAPPVTDTGLTASTSYDYRVKATNAGGDSPFSSIASATTFASPPPPQPPAAPSNLTATAISTTQINLAWVDHSSNETNFEIQQKFEARPYATIATVAAGVTSYSDVGLLSSTQYTYRVRATNAVGASAYSNEASATTATAPPQAPTNLTATPLSESSIQLSWGVSPNTVNYTLERSPHSAGTFVAIATVTTLNFTDTGLTASTSYDYRVKANNSGGSSPYSNIASTTTFTPPTPPTPPSAPSGLVATTFSQSQINLAWTDNSSDETNFQIERKLTTGGTFALIATVAAGVVAYSDAGLSASTSYTYRVRAVNAGGNSAYSNEATAVTQAAPPPPVPNAPSNLAASNPTQTSVFLTWTDNSTDETGFSLERAVGNGTFAVIQTLAPNITSYLDNVLTPDTTYRYRIRAFNANGNSAYSNIATNTTLPAPPPVPTAPTNLTGSQTGNQQVTLNWQDNSTNEVGFQIERRIQGVGSFVQIAQAAANVHSYIDTTVATNTYEYRVSAFNGSGSSAPTNVATVNVVVSGGTQQLLTPADFTYLGCFRMPLGTDTQFSYGGLTGRRVGGQLRLMLYGRNTTGVNLSIVSGTSPTVFTVGSGQGASVSIGDKIAIVRAANGNNVPEGRTIQNIAGDQITVTVALGGTPASGDTAYRSGDYYIYEVADPGAYGTDYTTAPRATLVTAWPDVYNGRRITWRNGQLLAPMQYQYPAGLYWHEGNQLLYWGYYDAYNGSTGYPDWCMGASSLDNPGTGASTAYGPWRPRGTDGNGTVWAGAARGAYFMAGPDGSFAGFGAVFGNLQAPYGPEFYAGANWPTGVTPSGPSAADLVFVNRYLEHYYMGSSLQTDGTPVGPIKSFRYPSSPSRPYLWEGLDTDLIYVNPAKTGGICSWTELNSLGGALWVDLPTRKGVLFAAAIVGSPDSNPVNVTAAHLWYQNSGIGHGTCTHGFGPPDTPAITGPVTTAAFPALIIYDPADLTAVKNGTKVDYTVNPSSWIDLQSTFNIRTPPTTTVGAARNIRGTYFDSTRNFLFLLSTQADNSIPGVEFALVHVFAINA